MSKKNIILMGFSGARKTTTANHISQKFGHKQIISSDTIHTKLRKYLPFIYKEGEENIHSTSYKLTQITTKIIQLVDIIIKSHSQEGVIYDACNLQESIRNRMGKILGEHVLIEVTATEKDLFKRLSQRENPEVWKKLYKEQKKNFEPANPDIVFNTSTEDFKIFDKKFYKFLQSEK